MSYANPFSIISGLENEYMLVHRRNTRNFDYIIVVKIVGNTNLSHIKLKLSKQ